MTTWTGLIVNIFDRWVVLGDMSGWGGLMLATVKKPTVCWDVSG